MEGGSESIKLGPFGSTRGQSWDGKGHANIVQIFVSYNVNSNSINSFQYQYADQNGNLMLSELHGKLWSNKFEVVKLNYPREFITSIRGHTDSYSGLKSITLGTNIGEYGPFGTISYKDVELSVKLGENRQFFGFYGTVNHDVVNSIGVYMKPRL